MSRGSCVLCYIAYCVLVLRVLVQYLFRKARGSGAGDIRIGQWAAVASREGGSGVARTCHFCDSPWVTSDNPERGRPPSGAVYVGQARISRLA